MPQKPQPREIVVDRILTNVSIGYAQQASGFVAPAVFPPVPVEQQSGSYDVFPRGYFLRDEVKPRPLGGPLELASNGKPTPKPYFCIEQGLADTIDDRQYANVRGRYDLEASVIEGLTQKLMIRQDREWVDTYFKTGVWSTDYEGVTTVTDPATQIVRFDESSSSPIKTFRQLKRDMELATGQSFNVAVIGADAYDVLLDDSDIIERIKYTQTGVIADQLLATMLGLDKIARCTTWPKRVYLTTSGALPHPKTCCWRTLQRAPRCARRVRATPLSGRASSPACRTPGAVPLNVRVCL